MCRGVSAAPKFGLPGIGPKPFPDQPQQSFQWQGMTRPNSFGKKSGFFEINISTQKFISFMAGESVQKPVPTVVPNGPPSFRTAHEELIAQGKVDC